MEERIESHIFKFVEKELYNYPVNKKLVENWQKEAQDISINSALGKDGDRFSMNQITDPTSAKALRLASMASKVDRAKWYIQAIDDVMDTLAEEDKHLVELKYFNGMLTNSGVAMGLHISEREFYNRRDCLIGKFGRRMGII